MKTLGLLLLLASIPALPQAALAPVGVQQFFDNTGVPLSGGTVTTYIAGTTTKLATYTDATGTVPASNPIVLDAGGFASIWLGSGSYKFVVKRADGVTVSTTDNISSVNAGLTGLANTWTQPQTIYDLITKNTPVDVRFYGASASSLDNTTAIQNAINAAGALTGGAIVQFPAGTFISGPLTLLSNVVLRGQGKYQTTLKLKNNSNDTLLSETEQTAWGLRDIGLDGNKANQTGTSYGIFAKNVTSISFPTAPRPQVDHVYITNTLSDGIHIYDNSWGEGFWGDVNVYGADGHGIYAGSYDTTWEHVDIGQSGLSGLYLYASTQHFTDVKSWFSGRVTPTDGYGVEFVGGTHDNQCISCEAQDNQASGFLVKGASQVIAGAVSSGNGQGSGSGANTYGFYLVGATASIISGSAHAPSDLPTAQTNAIRLDTSTNNTVNLASSGNTVGLVTGTTAGNSIAVLDNSGSSFIQFNGGISTYGITNLFDPNNAGNKTATYTTLGSTADTLYNVDPLPLSGGASYLRLFRGVTTAGSTAFQVYKGDGTATVNAQIAGENGATYFNADSGTTSIGTSASCTNSAKFCVTGIAYQTGGIDNSAQANSILKIKDQGACTMAAGTCSAQSLGHTYAAAPVCFANWNGTGTLTGLIKVPSTTTTVTPASSVGTDTAVTNWFCLGS